MMALPKDLRFGDILKLKKKHPCGSDESGNFEGWHGYTEKMLETCQDGVTAQG
ncbi:hypothetical protein CDSM653_02487 [Caldanaerobacter subterraneus subsp. pacificus DSM 12653]|uniref:Uncharacterized protein n=1 Tax=Caldanaerobacter subterraneus subsp. pacificus DSM 12653 TaxID=391606 RepID=A0A0F5PIH1_9THEO|nr:hypothetical protein CDSM653_02487 [Caldanaerobacter subterraneus subsp. pacificus DSM 12653]